MHDPLVKFPQAAGFTLTEALVVMALLGLMASLGAPAMMSLRQQHQLQAQAEALWSSLALARSEALRRQQRVTLCARASDSACDASGNWQQGWLVFADANDNAQFDLGEALLEVHAELPAGVQLSVSSTAKAYYSYNAQGRSATPSGAFMAGSWRFCRPGSGLGWQVVGNALGHPRLAKLGEPDCA